MSEEETKDVETPEENQSAPSGDVEVPAKVEEESDADVPEDDGDEDDSDEE